VLGRSRYRDRVFACWLGKNIGGTLGAPYEGRKHVNDLRFYHPVPREPLPNDDLDFQLVWLKMLEDEGLPPRLPLFADYWQRYLSVYPWDEYGFCARNLERGLRPPVSGWFENYFVDHMGSSIRSELWACMAPADPQKAAALAWMDSALDHAGGEGMHGEMFWAAVESAAFVTHEPLELIRIGLAMIPGSSAIARSVREAVWCWQEGKRWAEARERLVNIFGNVRPTHAVVNHGFTVLGWLYGRDFGDQLCHAVNCGYDTDCTGATLGALLGILGGTAYIPNRWSAPVGEAIKLHPFTGRFNAPKTVQELADRTAAVAERFATDQSTRVTFGNRTALPDDLRSMLSCNREAVASWHRDVCAAVAADGDIDITFHYNGEPVFYPRVSREVKVSSSRRGLPLVGEVKLALPRSWKAVKGTEPSSYVVTPVEVRSKNLVRVSVKLEDRTCSAGFTVLGPQAAKGYPAATVVEVCPKCRGRKGSCLCLRR
jgi:ADP-ribosylglycohydrolase